MLPNLQTALRSAFLTGALLLATSSPLQAQTLRWASQGDPMTMDPHAQNRA